MARSDDGGVVILLVGVAAFGLLYFTRNFCPSGAIPIDGLCYNSGLTEDSDCEDLCSGALCGYFKKGEKCAGQACGYCDPSSAGGNPEVTSLGRCCSKKTNRCVSLQTLAQCCAWRAKQGECPAGHSGIVSGSSCKCTGPAPRVGSGSVTQPKPKGTTACLYGYVRQGTGCVCNRVVKNCAANSVTTLQNKQCICKSCPTGYKRGTSSALDNRCLKVATPTPSAGYNPTGVKMANGKLFIASLMSTQIRNCTGKTVSAQQIVRGFPSSITSLARQNNFESKIVQYNNRPFAKLWRTTILGIVKAYRLNLNPVCTSQFACINSRSLRECKIF